MSWQALEAIDDVLADDRYGFTAMHASILQALAWRANHETGVTYSGPWLKARSRCSRATVSRVLADLTFAGVIAVEHRPGRAARIELLSTTRVTQTRVETLDPRHTDATPRHTDATPRHTDARTWIPDTANTNAVAPIAKLSRSERERLLEEGKKASHG